MALAKRQGRQKPAKTEQKEVQGPEWRLQVEQTALPAEPNVHGAGPGEGKNIKGGAKALSLSLSPTCVCSFSLSPSLSPPPPCALPLPSLQVFGLACPHASRMDSPAIF